jgi:hypothetical protein
MPSRYNGNLLGKVNTPVSGFASGVWSISEQFILKTGNTWPLGFSVVSGGTLTSDSTHYYRTFSANGTFQVSELPITVDTLILAGGGGGGGLGGNNTWEHNGGGGAGGFLQLSNVVVSTGSYPIVVGAGGSPQASGNSSEFLSNIAVRGGAGNVIGVFGSGGGGIAPGGSQSKGTGTPGQGFDGGNGAFGSQSFGGGGGGGAGSIGGNASGGTGGSGGLGKQWQNGVTYAGGGGGAGSSSTGGSSIGGNGSSGPNIPGSNATINTGSGGGGGWNINGTSAGGSGSSGLVIVRYLKTAVGG